MPEPGWPTPNGWTCSSGSSSCGRGSPMRPAASGGTAVLDAAVAAAVEAGKDERGVALAAAALAGAEGGAEGVRGQRQRADHPAGRPRRPAIRQVAVYEPALLMDTSGTYTSWVHRFDQEMAHGQVADALIASLRGLDLAPPTLRVMPRRLLVAVTDAAMRKRGRPGCPRRRHHARARSDPAL
jgi:hypothetical protein